MKKILVVGSGIVSPLGVTSDQVFNNLLLAKNNFKNEKRAYEKYGKNTLSSQIEISEFKKKIKQDLFLLRESNSESYLEYVITEALKDAKISWTDLCKKRIAIVIGTNDGQSGVLEKYLQSNSAFSQKYNIIWTLEKIAAKLGLKFFRAISVFNTCTSSSIAIEIGERYLRADMCDIVIAGSVDEFSKKTYAAFACVNAISKGGCTPFSIKRDGITIGEGAGAVIMIKDNYENQETIKNAYCEIVHSASSNDAKKLETPDKEGILLAYNKLFEFSSVSKENIDCIVSHGTGTVNNDKEEIDFLQLYFPKGVNVCSVKNFMGHMMSGSGICAAIIISEIFKKKIIPGYINYETIDLGKCELIKRNKVNKTVQYIINNTFGFGGNNTIILYKGIEKKG